MYFHEAIAAERATRMSIERGMTKLEDLGANIRAARKERGLTQLALALRTHSEQQKISRYERGLVMPSVQTLVKLADALECTTDRLLGRDAGD